jgi:hypothetical protein
MEDAAASHRGRKNHALSEAPRQSTAPTNTATPNALTSAGPAADITDPINAVAVSPPVRATALFNPDAPPT